MDPDRLDIWIVPWDLEESDNLSEGVYIEPEGNWNARIAEEIEDGIKSLDQYI